MPLRASCFLRKHSAPFFASFLSVMKEMKNSDERKERRILYLLSQGIHIQKVEPWPSPSEVTPSCTLYEVIQLHETLKYTGLFLLGDTGAGVFTIE